jgi:hypothetical protein
MYLPATARDWRLGGLNEDLGNSFGRVRVGGHGAVVGHGGSVTLRIDNLRLARCPPGRLFNAASPHGVGKPVEARYSDVQYSSPLVSDDPTM